MVYKFGTCSGRRDIWVVCMRERERVLINRVKEDEGMEC